MPANPPAEARSPSNVTAPVEGDSAGLAFLLYKDGDDTQRRFSLETGAAPATVGRGPSSDLSLDWDDQVSRVHARFEPVGEEWELIDDGPSRNGTFVNEQRLSGGRRLHDGDSLRFGTTTVTFHAPEAQQPSPQPEPLPSQPEQPSSQPEQSPSQPERSVAADPAGTPTAVSLSSTQRRVLVALCRPYKGRSGFASPASDQQIAEELFLSGGEVRVHLQVLRAKLAVAEQPATETRVQLVERAFASGLISEGDL